MKTYWSAFLSLLFLMTLAGCGNEQFGTGGQSSNSTANPLTSYSHQSCSNFTLIKPKVDVVYVVDNSTSTYYIPSDIKVALRNTVTTLSNDFDYRVIGTPLIPTANGNQEYQIMTNSSNLNGVTKTPLTSANDFNFFTLPGQNAGSYEQGFDRTHSFVSQHKTSGLIRSDAHIIIVLVSNGSDNDVERSSPYQQYFSANYNSALQKMKTLKNAGYQLRFNSVTAHEPFDQSGNPRCPSGYFSSLKSYVQMSKDIYTYTRGIEGNTDQDGDSTPDGYDLCGGGIPNIFSSVNNSIHQVLLAHGYRYWPITFAENNESVSLSEIQVTKIASNGAKVNLVRNVDWTYQDNVNPMSINTREVPTSGEPITGRHFIRFNNLLTYPDCVVVTSVSRTEYFDWVVLPRKPLLPVVIKVNGVEIPQSALSTSQVNTSQTLNIKAGYPTAQDENPPVMRTGFMIQITNPQYFYKSGDTVDTSYTPAGI